MQAPGETIHVLHVDDEPDFAELSGFYIEREDDRFSANAAMSAEQGLERLQRSLRLCGLRLRYAGDERN